MKQRQTVSLVVEGTLSGVKFDTIPESPSDTTKHGMQIPLMQPGENKTTRPRIEFTESRYHPGELFFQDRDGNAIHCTFAELNEAACRFASQRLNGILVFKTNPPISLREENNKVVHH